MTFPLLYQTQNTPAGEGKRHCSTSAMSSPMSCGKIKQKNSSLGSPLMVKKDHLYSPAPQPWKISMSK